MNPNVGTLRSLFMREPVSSAPTVFLWPHANCNCRCLMCNIWQLRSREEVSAADLSAWMPAWRTLGVRNVVLTGGEALMHSDLWSLCRVLRAEGIAVTLLSTGLLMSRYAREIAEHVECVNVSLDGPPEVHDEIRRIPHAFDKLAAGVRSVKDLRPGLPIVARSAINRLNARRLREMVAVARGMRLDGISFLATDLTSEAFNRTGGVDEAQARSLALDARDVADLEAELRSLEYEAFADFVRGFILETPRQLWERLVRFHRASLGDGSFPPVSCGVPWRSTVIEFDGTVRPCFFQPAYGKMPADGDLSALLNAPASVARRRSLGTSADPICRRCVCQAS